MTNFEVSPGVVTIVTAIVTALVTIMGFVISRKTEKIKIMESQLSEKKYKAYADAVDMFYSVLKDAKSMNGIKNENQVEKKYYLQKEISLCMVLITFLRHLIVGLYQVQVETMALGHYPTMKPSNW